MSEEKKYLPEIIDTPNPGAKYEVANFNEIKEALNAILEEYRNFKLTNYGDAKDLRARLNSASKTLNARKIAVKKEYLAPFEYGENQIKELISMIDEVSALVDKQIKDYEIELRNQKTNEIKELYKSIDNPRGIKLEKMWSEKWLNAGTSLKAIEKEINAFLTKVEEDIANIESLVADEERRAMTVKLYLDYLDMGKAITEEKRVYELTHQPKPEPVVVQEAEEIPAPAPVEEPKPEPEPTEPVQEYVLRISGTKTQLLKVRDFLKSKGLTFKFERN